MELKNSWHTKLAIGILLNDEETMDAKLNLLTEIGLAATNPKTFEICEELREQVLCEEVREKRTVKKVRNNNNSKKEVGSASNNGVN